MRHTIEETRRWSSEAKVTEASYPDFAAKNGGNIVVSRCVKGRSGIPRSLYLSTDVRFEALNDSYRKRCALPYERATTVIVASEPLTDISEDAESGPSNRIGQMDRSLNVEFIPII